LRNPLIFHIHRAISVAHILLHTLKLYMQMATSVVHSKTVWCHIDWCCFRLDILNFDELQPALYWHRICTGPSLWHTICKIDVHCMCNQSHLYCISKTKSGFLMWGLYVHRATRAIYSYCICILYMYTYCICIHMIHVYCICMHRVYGTYPLHINDTSVIQQENALDFLGIRV